MRARFGSASVALLNAALLSACTGNATTPEEMRARVRALDREIVALRAKLGERVAADPRFEGMPAAGVRVGVPTSLARTLIQAVMAGFVDAVTLRLSNIGVHSAGQVKKVVPLGDYDLKVRVVEVTGRLETGKPRVTFGGDSVAVSLPVTVAGGTGTANVKFKWSGQNVGGAVCGDMEVDENVAGSVKPAEYPLSGALALTTTHEEILATPRFPVVRIRLRVEPSAESWAVVQRILDSKEGLCGFVLGKVNLKGVLQGLLNKGFDIRLPTEKIRPMAIPVGITPTLTVRDRPVTVDVKVGGLAITEHMIWLGADVRLAAAPK